MTQSPKYTLMLFYNKSDQQSVKARIVVNEFVIETFGLVDITIREIDYASDKSTAAAYDVLGTPTIIVSKNGKLVGRHHGEVTFDELRTMISEM